MLTVIMMLVYSNMPGNDDEDSDYDDTWEHLSAFGSDSENDSDLDW